MTTNNPSTSRILAIDALRGFAVMGIILLHNIEHFNFYSFPQTTGTLAALDKTIWDMLFFIFSGKAYAIFALLFGFTFYLQSNSAKKRGEDFKNRYMWRLVLLLCFGFVNAIFFPGEILVLYAIIGFVLVPVRNMGNKTLFIIATILMLQPVEWAKVAYAAINPLANPQQMIFSLADVYPQLNGHSWIEMAKANFITGQLASLNWAWCYGRVFQTAALFIFGLLLGRLGYFLSNDTQSLGRSVKFWQKMLYSALPMAILLYFFKQFIFGQIDNPFLLASMETILNSWYNLAFMLAMTGAFLLACWNGKGLVMRFLAPYGCMSLTDYIMQSIIGSFLYYGYGLELHDTCGTTYSLLVGIAFFIAQVAFAHWWFRHFKRGPLETIWHKLTWISKKRD